jgi:hypothetical protein
VPKLARKNSTTLKMLAGDKRCSLFCRRREGAKKSGYNNGT